MLSTNQKGVIAETAIAHAAVKLWVGVSRPLSDLKYDFVFDVDGTLLRVQCKWAVRQDDVVLVRCYTNRRTRDGMLTRRYAHGEIDAFAAYCLELDRCYFLPFDVFGGRRLVHLRLAPSRNNQQLGIHWARDYEFAATLPRLGAVAQLGEHDAGSVGVRGSSPLGSTSESR